jgi:dienelactone hydrolase
LVVNAAGLEGWPHAVASWHGRPYAILARQLPSRHGVLHGRLYLPAGESRRAFVLTPGVHAAGIDEPRLVDFAGHLAARGYVVLTPELPDLRQYRITPRSTDMIEDAALWLAGPSGLTADGRVGIIGISFAGGLSVVAAGRPALRSRAAFVLSVGGHGDLLRTLQYLCTGRMADGTARCPHDYGLALVALEVADRLVPPAQVELFRTGVLTFLEASEADRTDRQRAQRLFRKARDLESRMPEPARTLMSHVNDRDVRALGPHLLPHVPSIAADASLSPESSPAPVSPVYLLHGASDNVIPPEESRLLATHLRSQTRVELLLTPLITHAAASRYLDLDDTWKLIAFWAAVLGE